MFRSEARIIRHLETKAAMAESLLAQARKTAELNLCATAEAIRERDEAIADIRIAQHERDAALADAQLANELLLKAHLGRDAAIAQGLADRDAARLRIWALEACLREATDAFRTIASELCREAYQPPLATFAHESASQIDALLGPQPAAKKELCSCGDGPSINEPLVNGTCINCRMMRGES